MARKLYKGISLLVTTALAYLNLNVTAEKLLPHLPQRDHCQQLQRPEEDLATRIPDEGPHSRTPAFTPTTPPEPEPVEREAPPFVYPLQAARAQQRPSRRAPALLGGLFLSAGTAQDV